MVVLLTADVLEIVGILIVDMVPLKLLNIRTGLISLITTYCIDNIDHTNHY